MSSIGEDMEQLELAHTPRGVKIGMTLENPLAVSVKLNIYIIYDPAIPF